MTVIAAIHEPGVGTWIGSDRLELRGWERRIIDEGKWAVGAHWAVGVSGPGLLIDIIKEHPEWLAEGVTPRQFAKLVADQRRSDGWAPCKSDDDDGGPPRFDGGFVLASACEIWQIDAAQRCWRTPVAFIGGGDDGARGAYFACQCLGVSAERAIVLALRAAIDQHAGCGGDPFVHLLRCG